VHFVLIRQLPLHLILQEIPIINETKLMPLQYLLTQTLHLHLIIIIILHVVLVQQGGGSVLFYDKGIVFFGFCFGGGGVFSLSLGFLLLVELF